MARDKVLAVHSVCGIDVYEVDESHKFGKIRLKRRVFRFVYGAWPYTAYACHSLAIAQETLERLTGEKEAPASTGIAPDGEWILGEVVTQA
jgi:hypothetical protein